MRKNATKLAAAVLSLAMVMTSVNMPASAAKTKVKLNKTKATLYVNGSASEKATTLKVTVNGKKVNATFKSSNTKVLTVAKKTGKVTAKKNGTAKVTATYKKKKCNCTVTVKTYATSVSITSAKTLNLAAGKTATIKATVKPSTASNKKVSFASSNKNVATVTSAGKVTAKKAGTATVTVKALGSKKAAKKATVKVNVKAAVKPSTEPTTTPTTEPTATPETPVATEGAITVTTNVSGASITIMDGATVVATGSTLTGTTFKTGKIKYGTYVVTVSKEGYKDSTNTVVLDKAEVSIDAKLETKENTVKAELKDAYKVNDTKIQVNFTNKIAVPTASNFSIAGLTVSAAEITEDQKSVILTVSGMELDKTYTVKTTGIVDANGGAVADGTTDFTARKIAYKAKMEFVDTKTGESRTELKSDGQDTAKVIVTLTDDAGNVIKDNAEIRFTTTAGNFAENKVAVQSGIATNLFTSEISSTKKDAYITATVTSAENKDLLNITVNRTISMNPNVSDGKDQTVGVSLTDAMVETCDRVVLYFNKDVNVTDFTKNTQDEKYAYDVTKLEVKIKDNAGTTTTIGDADSVKTPMALAPVPGETKALYAILPEGDYLTDNSKLLVKVTDKTKSIPTAETKAAYVTDIRTPSMLSATNYGLNQIKITFSEPVQNSTGSARTNSAEVLGKWVIDNTALTDSKYGVSGTKVTVGTFDKKTGEDNRNVVTISLGKDANGKQIYFKAGNHSVQGNNIGDWANVTDTKNNLINTQTLDFVVEADETAPTAKVKVESPEQYDVTFNTSVELTDIASKLKLQQYKNGAWVDVTGNPITVREVANTNKKEYIVELNQDWTKLLNTDSTKENYYNYDFRLHLDQKVVTNVLNGLENAEINLNLNDSIMKEPDVTSPKMTDVKQDGDTAVIINMSEPVQINPTGANRTLTPTSEQQGLGLTLSLPIVQFISSDNKKTIKGTITSISDHDNQITVKPTENMTAGTWKVVVRNVSDDVGNTAETLVKNDFVVTGTIVADTGFNALWVVAVPAAQKKDDPINKSNDGSADIIYVKFNKQIKTYGGAANAGATTNYTVDGYTVPSTSKIDSAVEGYNANANRKNNYNDLVAIHLPAGTLQGNSHTINISQTIESATGAKLENGGLKLLSKTSNIFTWGYTTYAETASKILKVSELQSKFDDGSHAIYNLKNVAIDTNDTSAKKFTLKHTSSVDFNNMNVEELVIDTQETGTVEVKNVTAEKITVNAPNADVILNGITVTKTGNAGSLEVIDVLDGTLKLDGTNTIDKLTITDANAGAVEIGANTTIKTMAIDTTGTISLDIKGTVSSAIDVNKTCTLNIESGVALILKLDAAVDTKNLKINEISATGATNNVTVKDKDDKNVTNDIVKKVNTEPTFSEVVKTDGAAAGGDKAATAGTSVFTVTGGKVAGTVTVNVANKDVTVDVAANASAEAIAKDIAAKVNADETLKVTYTATAEGAKVTISTKTTGVDTIAPTVTKPTFTATK